jgi:hypothetical protein
VNVSVSYELTKGRTSEPIHNNTGISPVLASAGSEEQGRCSISYVLQVYPGREIEYSTREQQARTAIHWKPSRAGRGSEGALLLLQLQGFSAPQQFAFAIGDGQGGAWGEEATDTEERKELRLAPGPPSCCLLIKAREWAAGPAGQRPGAGKDCGRTATWGGEGPWVHGGYVRRRKN